MKVETRYIRPRDIESVVLLPPADWNFDFQQYWLRHRSRSYFNCVVACVKAAVVGVGCAIINKDTAWLGTIIVHPEHRRRGIGRTITKELIRVAEAKGCSSILLIATSSGEKLYSTLGFQQSHVYKFYKGAMHSQVPDPAIRPILPADIKSILAIDFVATGERRRILLRNFVNGFVFVDNDNIRGFFLPDFGDGLIVAEEPYAGAALAKLKLSTKGRIVIPEGNLQMHALMKEIGFDHHLSAPRMFLKKDVAFKPEMRFARGAGYFG